jgi:YD repeat-containing protein
MTAIFTGLGSGLERGSANILGGAGQVGGGSLGRAGESVAVNAATGNLVINRRDEFLTGRGLDIAISRTYNSLAELHDGDNGDQWQQSTTRKVFGLVGSQNGSGSTIKRQGADGSSITYTWNSSYSAYISTDGSGAYDTLKKVGSQWVWTDGASQVTETYSAYGTNSWRIVNQKDSDNNTITFTYSGAKLSKVTTANGEFVQYHWSGNNITKMVTSAGSTLTRTYYTYDSSNRLIRVTTDLSEKNNALGSDKYEVNYSYVGSSNRIATITQTDGSSLAMVYDGSGRITRLTQTIASSDIRVTEIGYGPNVTSVTMPDGSVTRLWYDDKAQLVQLMTPPAEPGGKAIVRQFEYDNDGNVIRTIETDAVNGSGPGNLVAASGWGGGADALRGNNLVDDSGWPQDADGTLPANGTAGSGFTLFQGEEGEWLKTSGPYGEQIVSLHAGQSDSDNPGAGVHSSSFTVDKSRSYEFTLYFKADQLDKHRVYFGLGSGIVKDGHTGTYNGNPYFTYDHPNAASGIEAGKWYKMVGYVLPESSGIEAFGSYGGVYDIETGAKVRDVRHFIWDDTQSSTSTHTRFFNYYNQERLGKFTHFYKPEVREVANAGIMRADEALNVAQDAALFKAPLAAGWRNDAIVANDDEARWTEVVGPDGARDIALEAGQFDAVSHGGGNMTNAFTIDGTKAYKVTQYFRKSDLSKHNIYIGLNTWGTDSVLLDSNGSTTTNPYFLSWSDDTQRQLIDEDKWYKVVSYVLPEGSANGAGSGLGGVYDAETGERVASVANFRWNENRSNDQAFVRFFNYYDETQHGWSVDWLDPEVVELDPTSLATDSANPFGINYHAGGRQTYFEYDANGNVARTIDPNGNVITRTYDANNRLTSQKLAGSSENASHISDVTQRDIGQWSTGGVTVSDGGTIDGQPAKTYTSAVGATWSGVSHSTGPMQVGDKATLEISIQAVGDITSQSVGLYGSTSGWGSNSNMEARILSGPGKIVQLVGGLWRVDGLSTTQATRVQIVRTYTQAENGGAYLYIDHPGGYRDGAAVKYAAPDVSIVRGSGQELTTRYVYDSADRLRYMINADGGVTEYRYTPEGLLQYTITYPEHPYPVGSALVSLSQMNSWRDGLGDRSSTKVTVNAHDARGNLTQTTNYTAHASGGTFWYSQGGETVSTTYLYDQAGQLLQTRTGSEDYNTFVYDGMGRVTATTDANGGTTSFVFQDSATKTVITNAAGAVTTNTYNKAGELISQTTSGSYDHTGTSSYKYDEAGRLRVETDETGYNSYFLYDRLGRKVADINHLGDIIEYRYDDAGQVAATVSYIYGVSAANLTTLADPNNTLQVANIRPASHSYDVWSWSVYDTKGRVIQTIDGAGGVSKFEYDKADRLVKTTNYYNKLSSSQLSSFRSTAPTALVLPSANSRDTVSRVFYDRAGRAVGALDGEGYLTETVYDNAGQKIREIAYFNKTSSSLWASGTFNQLRSNAGTTNSKNRSMYYAYDGKGQLRFTVDNTGRITENIYWEGTKWHSVGLVRKTIAYAATISTSDYTYDSLKAKAAAAANSTNDRVSSFTYNAAGKVATATDVAGTRTTYTYDNRGNVTKQIVGTGSSARTTRYWYTGQGDLRFMVDAEGYVQRYDYDNENRLTREVSWSNKVSPTDSTSISQISSMASSAGSWVDIRYTYDAAGRRNSMYDGEGNRTVWTWFRNGLLSSEYVGYTDSSGASTDRTRSYYVYDGAGRKTRDIYAHGTSERTDTYYYYDGLGNVTSTKDPNGRTTSFTYDETGRVLTSTDANGGVTRYEYNAFGEVVKATDARGNSTYTYYDSLGRVTKTRDAENYITETTYTQFGEVKTVTRRYNRTTSAVSTTTPPSVSGHSKDAVTRFEYDKRGLVTKATDAEGHFETYTYDAYGNRVTARAKSSTTSKVAGGTTTYTYDKRGLLLSEQLPVASYNNSGSVVASTVTNRYEYDARGNRTKMIEASGLAEQRTTQYVYDKANRLKETIGQTFLGKTPREYIYYDARGNVTETKDAGGGRTIYFYDDLNRKVVEINAVGTYTRYTYDKNSNVTQVRVYDSAVGLPSSGGALAEAPGAPSGGSRITNFTYDNLNRLKTSSITGARTGYWNGSSWVTTTAAITTTYQYDANGNVVKLTDPNGNTVWNYYDKAGRKTSMVDGERYRTDYTYDTNGNVTRERRFVNKAANPTSTTAPPSVSSNGSLDRITDFTYDKNGNRLTEKRLNVLKHNGSGAHTNAHSTISYLYNGLGQVTRKTEATGERTDYVYDAGGRLTQEKRATFASHSGNVTPTVDYYYNGVGDLARTRARGQSGVAERVTRYTYDGGKLRTMIDAEGFTRYYWYHQSGLLSNEYYKRVKSDGTYAANYDGVYTAYDKLGRVTHKYQQTHNGSAWVDSGPKAITTYNAHGDVASVAVGGRTQTQNKYDAAGRLWATNSGDGIWKYIGYDKNGNQTLAISSAGFNTANRTFDYIRGQIGRSDVNATYTQYDKRNLATKVVEEGRQHSGTTGTLTSSRTYNAFGEVATETNAKGAKIEYTYNNMGKLIKSVNPTVQITNENGSTQWIKPTEDYYYDASGRLVASRDANGTYANGSSSNGGAKTANTGRLTKLSLLAGTGYDGSQALVTKETFADGGIKQTKFDIHGDARTLIDQVNRTTTQSFDKLGRVTQVNHAHGLVENFAYDGLGQQIKKWNNFLVVGAFYDPYTGISNPGTPEIATTDYDTQGRIVRQKDFGGDVTTHTYTWDSNLSTGSAGTFGGWTEVKTYANNKSMTEKTDFFGRMVSKNDLGNRTTTYTYDVAGRLRTSAVSGLTTTFNYFNTGMHSSIVTGSATAGQVNTNWTRETASYTYDQIGQRLTEHLRQETAVYVPEQVIWWNPYEPDFIPASYSVNNLVVKNATATYDKLGRVSNWSEAGSSISPAASTAYKYDAVGNIRRTTATHKSLDANGNAGATINKDYWFRYDNMNRVVIDRGVRSGSTIVRGNGAAYANGTIDTGKEILYNKAGERTAVLTTKYTAGFFFKGSGLPGTFAEQRESYTYDVGGRLTEIKVSTGAVVNETTFGSGVPSGTIPAAPVNGTRRSAFVYDLMGRQLTQTDYAADGTTIVFSRQASYDSANRLTTDTTNTKRGNDTYRSITSYNYGAGSTYALGSVVYQTSTNYKNNNSSQAPNTRTDNTFFWRDGAVQATIRHKPNSSQSTTYTTSFIYDGLGRLTQANVGDYYSQTVKFTNDENGQIIRRDETSIANSTGAPHEVWYRFGGRQLGYVGNNGTSDVSTEKSIQERTSPVSSAPPGVFRNGATIGSSYADFAQSYDPLNSYSQGAGGGSYTVNKGDTLQSIAQSVYGDANLWYKIAQQNGISGNVPLSEGMRINLPTGVVRSAHNSGTVSPYNPGEAIGDLTPTTTAPPKKGKKCGVLGAIVLAVVAIAVTVVTAGAFFAAAAPGVGLKGGIALALGGTATATAGTVTATAFGAVVAGGIGAAAGSIVTQGIKIAAGVQEKFSWKGVGLAAIGGAVSGGLGKSGLFGTTGADGAFTAGRIGIKNAVVNAGVQGAASSALTQGIGLVTGLQDKFSWAGVAAAGIGAAAGRAASGLASRGGHGFADALGLQDGTALHTRISASVSRALVGAASAIANAATRSAIDGSSFGDNVVQAIPDVVAGALQAYASACFVPETLIQTPSGLKRIDEIKVGDLVYSRDEHFKNDRVQTRRVIELYRFEDRATLDVTIAYDCNQEETIRTTPEHPFAVVSFAQGAGYPRNGMTGPANDIASDVAGLLDDGDVATAQEASYAWRSAGDLSAGDRVIDINGRSGMVVAIEPVGPLSTVHNFAVEDYHTYFVGKLGTWVHNRYDTAETIADRVQGNLDRTRPVLRPGGWYNQEPDQGAIALAGAELVTLKLRNKALYNKVISNLNNRSSRGNSYVQRASAAETRFERIYTEAFNKIKSESVSHYATQEGSIALVRFAGALYSDDIAPSHILAAAQDINSGPIREFFSRGLGLLQGLAGTVSTVIFGAGTVASAPACTTVVGCAAPVGMGVLTALSADQALAGYRSAFGSRSANSITAQALGDLSGVDPDIVDMVLGVGLPAGSLSTLGRTVRGTGIVWGRGIQGQGAPWEVFLAGRGDLGIDLNARVKSNFRTYDFWNAETGTATSAKTLNTNTDSFLNDPRRVSASIRRNIDDIVNFPGDGRGNFRLDPGDIQNRRLELAVPSNVRQAQWAEIQRAINYGAENNVVVAVTKVGS